MDTQFKKGVMDLCVLSILEKKDYYGYELVQKVSKEITISEGTIYPILKRLKNENYLTTYLKESSDGPSRKYYALTKEGKKKATNTKKDWLDFTKKVQRLLK